MYLSKIYGFCPNHTHQVSSLETESICVYCSILSLLTPFFHRVHCNTFYNTAGMTS